MLVYSAAVSNLVTKKIDCLAQVKKLAVFSNTGYFRHHPIVNALFEAGVLDADLILATASRPNGFVANLVFVGDEASMLEKIGRLEVKPRKKMPTPPNVLVKMVASRLSKMHDAIDGENKYRVPTVGPNALPALPPLEFEDLIGDMSRFNGGWEVRRLAEELVSVLNRQDMTPEVVQKAWDTYSVKAVMAS